MFNISDGLISDTRVSFAIIAIISLSLLQSIESMQGISYISEFAMGSVIVTFAYIAFCSVSLLLNPTYEKELDEVNFSGLGFFIGIAMYVLEGNALAVDIYH